VAILAVVIISLLVLPVALNPESTTFLSGSITISTKSNGTTFSQYGITIQYPSGASERPGIQQNSDQSGLMQWFWNGGSTYLALMWTNDSNVISGGYAAFFSGTQLSLSNNTIVSSGNITIDGQVWQYETFHYYPSDESSSQSLYETAAAALYKSEGRLYSLTLSDTTNDTLSKLQYWASTFVG
jgi:hypothetical protein